MALAWGLLARARSETWWWVAGLDLMPPQVLLPVPLLLAWALRRQGWGWPALNLAVAVAFSATQVGLVLPRPSPAPEVHAVEGPSLRLLTLNADFAGTDPARLATLVQGGGVDVLVLQEALSRDRNAGYEARVRAALPGWFLARHDELITLSRWPLRDTRAVPFPRSPHAVLATTVETPAGPLMVVNTHLPTLGLLPSESDTRLGRSLAERVSRRLAVRRDFVEVVGGLLRDAPGPLVLAGDLNAPPRGELHVRLRSLGLTDAFAAEGTGFGFTHHARLGHSRIDYVWTRGLTTAQASALPDVLSDHRVLTVSLLLIP